MDSEQAATLATTDRTFEPLLEESLDIAAPVAVVWDLVRDPRRMAQWSPQVRSCTLIEGDDVSLGTRFVNVNEEGAGPGEAALEWTTHGEVVRLEPNASIAFRIEENWAVWSLTLEPLGADRTRLVERRETPEGLSELALDLTDAFMGGQRVFTRALRAGMAETLARIRAAAENPPAGDAVAPLR